MKIRMLKGQIDALIERARVENRNRDQTERRCGLGVNSELGLREIAKTACFAIKAGLATGDVKCYAEAFAMLDDEVKRLEAMRVRLEAMRVRNAN